MTTTYQDKRLIEQAVLRVPKLYRQDMLHEAVEAVCRLVYPSQSNAAHRESLRLRRNAEALGLQHLLDELYQLTGVRAII